MRRTTLRIITIIFIALISIQCSDSPSSGVDEDIPDNDPDPDVSQACENITLLSDSGQPTDFVTIEGFSQEFGQDAYAWMFDPEEPSVKNPIAIYPDFAEETAVFALPLHPINQMEGGTVEIEIVEQNQDFSCSGFSFTIEALTPSPGASEELLDTFSQGIEEIIIALGYDPDKLNDKTVEEIDPALAPLLMAYHSIDSDIFENDLTSFIDGTAPALNGEQLTPEQKELFDAIVAESDFATYVDDFLSSYLADINSNLGNQKQNSEIRLYKRNTYEIHSPGYISSLMKIQETAQQTVTGFIGATRQAAALTTGLVSLVAGIAAVGTAGASAPIAVAAGYASATISASFFITKGIADLLPSQLVFLDLVGNKATFEEDYNDIVGWDNLMVVEGRNFSVSITDIISFLPSGKIFELKKVTGAIGEINAKLLELMAELNLSIVSNYDDSEVLEIKKSQWGILVNPERENEETYFSWEIDFLSSWDGEPPVFGMCTKCTEKSNFGYYPFKEGTAELKIEANAEPFNFPSNPIDTQEIAVLPIYIDLEPVSTSLTFEDVKSGETIVYNADVSNAINEELEWSADEGFFTYNDDLAHNVTYYPPEKLGSYTITAEAITEMGPREGLEPPRTQTAKVKIVEEEEITCFIGDPSNDDTYEVTVEASGSYEELENGGEFAITYSFVEPRENKDSCTNSGTVFSDEISLPWSTSEIITAPGGASINMVGLTDHSNNVTLRILVDGDEVASYTHQGILGEEDIVPETQFGNALTYTLD